MSFVGMRRDLVPNLFYDLVLLLICETMEVHDVHGPELPMHWVLVGDRHKYGMLPTEFCKHRFHLLFHVMDDERGSIRTHFANHDIDDEQIFLGVILAERHDLHGLVPVDGYG